MTDMRALPFVLGVLDDGLRLYRQHFGRFVLLATVVLVPFALLALLAVGIVETELGTSEDWMLLVLGVLVLIGYPLGLYLFAAVSRATTAFLDGQAASLRTVLRISPIRGCGMAVWSMLFGVVNSIVLGMVTAGCQCLMLLMLVAIGSALEGAGGAFGSVMPFGILFGVLGQFWIFVALVGWGMALVSNVYIVQPFALERRAWGASVSQGIDMLVYRFRRNLLVFGSASVVLIGGVAAVLVPLLLMYSFLSSLTLRSTFFIPTMALEMFATFLGITTLAICLPVAPILMTVLYRRVAAERSGVDLAVRIENMYKEQMLNAER